MADSALRSGAVTPQDLAGAALPRTGRDAARRVLDAASAQPVNAFESGPRGLAMEASGGDWMPPVPITARAGTTVHADVGDPVARIALEADSHEFHKERKHVMCSPDWVREIIAWVCDNATGCRSAVRSSPDGALPSGPAAVRHAGQITRGRRWLR